METFFKFKKKLYGGVWEIESDMPYQEISEIPFDETNLKLLDLPFRICHGKKQRDIIYYYEDISIEFLSQNIYDFLSQYGDMKPYLYPIRINEVDGVYYFVHNLPECTFININVLIPNTNFEREVSCFFLKDNMPPFFTLNQSRLKIINSKMKESLEKAKLTNIAFEPVYGVSSMEEYYELQKEGKLHRP